MSIPEYPLGENKGWKKVNGRIYEARINVNGERRLVTADAASGLFKVSALDDPLMIIGTFDGTKFNLSVGESALENADKKLLEKTIPLRIYNINQKVVEITKATNGVGIATGEGISESEQINFRNLGIYKTIGNTINPNPFDDISNLTESGNINPVNSRRLEIPPEGLTYPITQSSRDTQDYIQFGIGEYNPKSLKIVDGQLGKITGSSGDTLTNVIGYINLPIQPSIVDSNSVGWNEDNLNPIQVAGLQVFESFRNQGIEGLEANIKSIYENTKEGQNDDLIRALKLQIAQASVGAKNVLSRFGGAVVNPNLELLFTGPQLRPFNFNFKLSPRSGEEGQVVKSIIRAFKQSMAAKVTNTGLFLAAPNIFSIKYIQAGGGNHPSLNRIKLCALKSCVVDYTPENSYMTFKDSSNTMVSYNMSLQFQELEPVTDVDYDSLSNDLDSNVGVEIGY